MLARVAQHLAAHSAAGEEEAAALRSRAGAYERSGQAEGKSIGAGLGAFGSAVSSYQMSTRDNTPLPEPNSFGVSSVIPGLGVLPRKVRTAAEAAECVRRDGAVILTGLDEAGGDYWDAAAELPEQLFGGSLLAATPPVSVGIRHKNNAEEMRQFCECPDPPPPPPALSPQPSGSR